MGIVFLFCLFDLFNCCIPLDNATYTHSFIFPFATEPSKQSGPTPANWISLPKPLRVAQLRAECCPVAFAIVDAHDIITKRRSLQS
jgi:hypothetical protein